MIRDISMPDFKLLIADTPTNTAHLQRTFDDMHVPYTRVTLHTSAGRLAAFRISTATCIYLTTLKLTQPN